jgi:hypothetical protein
LIEVPKCRSRDALGGSRPFCRKVEQHQGPINIVELHAIPPSPPASVHRPKMLAGRLVAQAARSAAPRASIASRTAFRTYATPAAGQSGQNVNPPIALYGIDGTYATALVRLKRMDQVFGRRYGFSLISNCNPNRANSSTSTQQPQRPRLSSQQPRPSKPSSPFTSAIQSSRSSFRLPR